MISVLNHQLPLNGNNYMKQFSIRFFLLFTFALSYGQKFDYYTLDTGETLDDVSTKFNVIISDLIKLNPELDNGILVLTDSLIVPLFNILESQNKDRKPLNLVAHKVKRKETLYSISKDYKLNVSDLKKYNPQLYTSTIKKGDILKVPVYKIQNERETLSIISEYIVRPKEGKWRIAYQHGLTINELELINPTMNPILNEGDIINVPIIVNNKDNLEGYGFYEVMPSEGFFRIKQKIGLTQEQLEEFNPRLIEEGLKPGMILKFPESLSAYYEAVFEPVDLKSQITNLSAKNLVVMLPFNLELIDTDSIVKSKNRIKKNQLLSAVLDFHSGVLIAIDSAKQIGISTNLRVYDTQKRNSDRIKSILIDENFSNADAVIGPVTQGNFDLVSERVLDEETPVLSPLLNFNTRFPNSIQTLVPKQLLSERIINFIKRDTSKVTLTLISDQAHKVVSDSLKTQFTDALQLFSLLDKDENDAYFFDELGIDEEDIEEDSNYQLIQQHLKPGVNYVFLETANEGFVSNVTSILNGLVTEDIKIILTTSSKNRAFEGVNISNKHLSNLNFLFASNHRFIETQKKDLFFKTYAAIYGVNPNKFAVRGFDITYDLLLRLSVGDSVYYSISNNIQTEYVENKFRYSLPNSETGSANQSGYLLQYNDLKIKLVK